MIVVVVQIFNATRHPRHMEAAAIVMYMYLYSLVKHDSINIKYKNSND